MTAVQRLRHAVWCGPSCDGTDCHFARQPAAPRDVWATIMALRWMTPGQRSRVWRDVGRSSRGAVQP